jgi:thiosulfate/3-mercaptopyruvate sulfurtransferase
MNSSMAAVVLALIGGTFLSVAHESVAADQANVRSEMLVSTAWLEEHLSDRDLVIVYVGRNRSGYDAGHIPGARFLALDELVEQHQDSLNDLPPAAALQDAFESVGVGNDSRVVLYGDGGGMLAARAYFTLDYLGLADRAALLDGGMEKWAAEGKPIEHKAVQPTPAKLTPHLHADILITTAKMHEVVAESVDAKNGDFVLLDARPLREFDGAVMSEAVPKAGHLPGARSLYWKTLLQSESVPVLRDAASLQATFQSTGADRGNPVITYCRTGMQSSFTYFVAKYLGYRVAMYDGSVYEWVNRAGYDLVVSPLSSEDVPSK